MRIENKVVCKINSETNFEILSCIVHYTTWLFYLDYKNYLLRGPYLYGK